MGRDLWPRHNAPLWIAWIFADSNSASAIGARFLARLSSASSRVSSSSRIGSKSPRHSRFLNSMIGLMISRAGSDVN